jgi:hypothetical protein
VVVGLLVSFAIDLASGGTIVLVSMAVFAVCVIVKRVFKMSRPAVPSSTCDHAEDPLAIPANEARKGSRE